MKTDISRQLFDRARPLIPGGVNSPVRACRSVGTDPLFICEANGCRLTDVDGNVFIDYVGSWGPMIVGHRHPKVVAALSDALSRGTSYGAPTELEIELAEQVCAAVPSVEMIRMVNSGTEATMSAIRLARGYTQRNTIIKFDGCYHGHADALLVEAGSGVATLQIPGSSGVPSAFIAETLSLPYNDVDTFSEVMQKKGDDIACVIVEPIAGNMGLVPPISPFLETLRRLTEKHGALLIFDEVMTGFRVALGGAQQRFGIFPDLSCFGKIIGGGLPVGAYGGRREIMEQIAPTGPVYQAGTLSGNPLAMAAGIATLALISEPGFYDTLEARSHRLITGLAERAEKAGIPVSCAQVGAMLGLFFTDQPVKNYADAKTSDLSRFSAYYKGMRENGVYLAPSQFEAFFISSAHDDTAIDQTLAAAETVFSCM
ncbi:glutamate-1-semialdehyde 2,1-aminomutase [Desulfosarcina sp. OttesenSCG-928-A07]|nr:glutamate-1-semialdehyde 2,1-aminomutase [Desulfosarcina sp. OttesenSCG-928-G17]MDL2329288.1 glutamate-1-semialdehyde 2,1-aminomutase [Desulfosarcina sp. OttesenSCG-928-A07]